MSKVLKSYRFDKETLEKLEFIIEARKELGWFEFDRTSIIEQLIWSEAGRLRNELAKEKEGL